MIALILGGGPAVWDDLAAANTLLGARPRTVVAANLAGIHYPDHLDAWASLHPDHLPRWIAQRAGSQDFRSFTPERCVGLPSDVVAERWPGSSGLYAAQVALTEMGASGAILCGVPMDRAAGHFALPGQWADTASYRQAFQSALPTLGARLRSMGGWTAELLGRPTEPWVAALITAKPLGASRPQHQASPPMHTVKNESAETRRFKAVDESGAMFTAILAPGESGAFQINPAQVAFQTGDLKVTKKHPRAADAPAPAPSAKA